MRRTTCPVVVVWAGRWVVIVEGLECFGRDAEEKQLRGECGLSDVDITFPHVAEHTDLLIGSLLLIQSPVGSVVAGAVASGFESLGEIVWTVGTSKRSCAHS